MSARFRPILRTVILVALIPLLLPIAGGSASGPEELRPPQEPAPTAPGPTDATLIDQLQQATQGQASVSYHARTGKVRFIGSNLDHPIRQPAKLLEAATAEDAARHFLVTYGQLFGLTDQARELTLMRTRGVDRGRSFVRFQQVYRDIPVLGGELIVQLDADRNIISANGEVLPNLALDSTPRLDAAAARETALGFVAKSYRLSNHELTTSEPELWIYNPILLKPGPSLSSLVWRMDVYARDLRPIDELVLVDAQSGAVVLHFNQIAAGKNRVVYDNNNDPQAGLPGNGPVRTEGQPPTGNADVDKAYDYAGDTYDFYLNMHGRDSLDNHGMTLVSTVRYCESDEECPLQNAFWSPEHQQMVYGQGEPLADDTVAHELTHGVTNLESNLFYYMQSGAMNESLSDIWGEFVDLTNGQGNDTPGVRWLLFEDNPEGAGRNMKDPANPPNPCAELGDPDCNVRQPDKMTGSPHYYCGEGDNGGVHINSGIGNKATYLMVDGGAFNGYSITGIGIEKAAKIFYEVQTNLLTSAADYNDLYDGLQQACTDLIGTSGITPFDCQQVRRAAGATEMNQQPAACPAIESPLCPVGQSPVNLFFDNLEAGADNWRVGREVGNGEWLWDNSYATSGTHHLWGDDIGAISDHYVYMNSDVALPAGSTPFLHFNHAYAFEDDAGGTYDGGVVEYTTSGGASWTDGGSLFANNGYNGAIDTRLDNPLGGRPAFVSESNGYMSSRLNLSSLAGQNVRFRFRIGADKDGDADGWFIDDVRVYTCAASGSGSRVYLPVVVRNYAAPVHPTPTPTLPGSTPTSPAPEPTATTAPGVVCEEYISNNGFEEGFAGWTLSANVERSDHAYQGDSSAWLGGYDNAEDWLGQEGLSFPPDIIAARLTFFMDLTTNEDPNVNVAYDDFCVGIWPIGTPTGNALISMGCRTNLDATDDWTGLFYDFTPADLNLLENRTRSLWFRVRTDNKFFTSVFLDEVSLQVCTEGG
ncbi:MAG: M4 family metallopeptidase [Anaerolineae bacterium]